MMVQSRFTQIGPRSVSELESVLTLLNIFKSSFKFAVDGSSRVRTIHPQKTGPGRLSNFMSFALAD